MVAFCRYKILALPARSFMYVRGRVRTRLTLKFSDQPQSAMIADKPGMILPSTKVRPQSTPQHPPLPVPYSCRSSPQNHDSKKEINTTTKGNCLIGAGWIYYLLESMYVAFRSISDSPTSISSNNTF